MNAIKLGVYIASGFIFGLFVTEFYILITKPKSELRNYTIIFEGEK